jgi:O-6-methylguanine DNA methyltransferase
VLKNEKGETGTFSHPLISFSVQLIHSGGGVSYLKKICFFNENRPVDNGIYDRRVLVIGERILKFLNGEKDNFMDLQLDFSELTSFQKCVLETARKIPRGYTVHYQDLAQMSGHQNAVRAVASVMRNNRFPLVIPCHRVVRKDGTTGGYCGAQSGPMFELKKQLIGIEKVLKTMERM